MIAMIALVIFALYVGIAWLVTKYLPNKTAKWIAIMVFVLIPTWDEMVGTIFLRYLCSAEGGPKISKTIVLDKEYFLRSGEINEYTAGRVLAKGGELNMLKIQEKYSLDVSMITVSPILNVKKYTVTVKEKQSQELVASDVDFKKYGGWILRNSGLQIPATSCPARTNSYYEQFYNSIFKQAKN
jgi:hypothetical protein